MLPKTLALIDDDAEYVEFLSHDLQQRGVAVDVFGDSNDLLAHVNPYAYAFYVVDLMLPGIDGIDLIKVLRRRSSAGILVVSGRLAPDVFEQAIGAGADMYLAKPANFEQVALAVEAVILGRRARGGKGLRDPIETLSHVRKPVGEVDAPRALHSDRLHQPRHHRNSPDLPPPSDPLQSRQGGAVGAALRGYS